MIRAASSSRETSSGKVQELNEKHTRLIFLSQLFDPEPTFKGLAFAKALAARGFDVEVVTGFPNYPGGRVYDGYRIAPIRRETHNGIDVTRLAVYPSHDRSPARRAFSYVSFFLSALIYLCFGARRADVVYVSFPSLTTGLAAVCAKLFRRTPIVLDIQDMWPDSLDATGMIESKRLLGIVNYLCKVLYRRVDHIVVLSPGFRNLLIERGVPADKLSVIYNWAEEVPPQPSPALPDAFDPTDRFRVLFAGNMGPAQSLTAVLDAAREVARRRIGIVFYFLGSGLEVDALKQYADENGLVNVRFLPRVPLAEVQRYLAATDCLLVHLKKTPLFAVTIPSKTQAYLYSGKPVLMAVEGDASELVIEAGAGLVARPEDAHSIASAVLEMADMAPERRAEMGENGRRFYASRLSFAHALDELERVLKARRRPGRGS